MIPIGSQLKKTAILLLITTLTISLGTSTSFTLPEDDVYQDDALFAVDTSDVSGTIKNVTLSAEDPNDETGSKEMTEDEQNNYTTTFGRTDIESTRGDYDITAETYLEDDSIASSDSLTVTFDDGGPEVQIIDEDDSDYVQNDPELTFEVSDDYSEVQDVTASITSGDAEIDGDDSTDPECEAGDTCEVSFDVDTSDMDEGDDFSIEVTATDEVDNTGSTEPSFTLDTSWDGDDSADVEWDESGSNVLDGYSGEDQDVLVSFEPDSVSDTSISCEVDGDEVSSDSVGASDDEETLDCGFDHNEYEGSSFDLTVVAEDEAGNSETIVDDKNMVWDTQAPSVSDLSQSDGISTFNSGFNLDLVASDDASGIQMVEYYFDVNTDVGNGNQVNLDSPGSTAVDREVNVDPSGLGQGNHTAYVRVEDSTGQIDTESFDFEYFPDRDPEVNFNAPDSVEVTSGETESFSLTIENGAPFYLNGVEVQSDNAIWNGTVTATGLEEDDSVEKTITVDASNVDVGTYDLLLETVDLDDSVTVEVIVRATEDQKSQIESDLQEWSNLSNDLKENVSSIGTLDESNENVSSFLTKISNVQTAVDEGRYYEAKNILDSVDSDFENAQETYSKALDEHRSNRKTQLLLLLVVGVLVLGGGGIAAFFLLREEEEMLEELDIEVPELGVIEKLKELVDQAEDEVEEETGYNFDGFD